jgi:hypothetical protein
MPVTINGSTGVTFPNNTLQGTAAPTGGLITTGNITLTSASAADQYVTPSAHGFYAILPNATTLIAGPNLFTINNNSNFFYGIEDNTGTTLCFVPPFSTVSCSLASNSTAAGTWNFANQQQLGTAAQAVVSLPSGTASALAGLKIVNLDSRYQVLVFVTGEAVYAVAYDNVNNTFGSVVLVRTVTLGGGPERFMPIKVSATSLLLLSCSTTTALEAVVLSLSGTTITVNTPATATLAGNIVEFADIQVVGSSYVFSYARATNIAAVRAITISGTTVTIGAESTLTGTYVTGNDPVTGVTYPASIFVTSSSTFLAGSIGSGAVNIRPYTVSGTTLTAGTQASVTASSATNFYLNSNNRLMFLAQPTGQFTGYVVSVSGTTASISSVNLVARGTTASTFNTLSGALYTGAQILFMFNQTTSIAGNPQYQVGFNVLTDNAGTAVAGTADVTQQSSASICRAYMVGLDATSMYAVVFFNNEANGLAYITAGISGNNPSILSTAYFTMGYGLNTLEITSVAPTVYSLQQRPASAINSMGNPTRGDFVSANPLTNNTNGAANIGLRMGKNSIGVQPLNSLRLGYTDAIASTGGTVSATISNTFSNSTTLNQYGEYWSISAVQAIRIGGTSYSKVVITRLVYA